MNAYSFLKIEFKFLISLRFLSKDKFSTCKTICFVTEICFGLAIGRYLSLSYIDANDSGDQKVACDRCACENIRNTLNYCVPYSILSFERYFKTSLEANWL